MSKYNSHFANEDRMLASKASRELLERRQHMLHEFNAWKNALLKQYNAEKPQRIELRGKDTDNVSGAAEAEEELEILISSVKEVFRKCPED